MVLSVQLSSTRLSGRRRKENEKTGFAIFSGCFGELIFLVYVLDIDVTRNGNNLKLKIKSEISLSMGLMLINHSNPYIHSTTVLCDKIIASEVSFHVSSMARIFYIYYCERSELSGLFNGTDFL